MVKAKLGINLKLTLEKQLFLRNGLFQKITMSVESLIGKLKIQVQLSVVQVSLVKTLMVTGKLLVQQ